MRIYSIFLLTTIALLSACSTSKSGIVPVSESLPNLTDNYPIVWVGTGTSYRFEAGAYQRTSSNDYAFEVVQRRYPTQWKSIKNMHRIHPEYDGKAGPREQTMFFQINFTKSSARLDIDLQSSLGNGWGHSDPEFRRQSLEFKVEDISSFAPYNRIRISQQYQYEAGVLEETVELFKLKNGQEIPFAKIEERATIFRPTVLEAAPTVFE